MESPGQNLDDNHHISPEFVLSQYKFIIRSVAIGDLTEARSSLAELARQLIYVTSPTKRFFNPLISTLVLQNLEQENDVAIIKEAFHCLEMYCQNLIKQYWKKEIKSIKRYTGKYRNLLLVVPEIDKLLEEIGYDITQDSEMCVLKRYGNTDRIFSLGFDCFLAQNLVEYLQGIFKELEPEGYSWQQIVSQAPNFTGTESECLRWFRKVIVPKTEVSYTTPSLKKRSSASSIDSREPKHSKDCNNHHAPDGFMFESSGHSRMSTSSDSHQQVQNWLQNCGPEMKGDHFHAKLERHREAERQRALAQDEEDTRRRYNDLARRSKMADVNSRSVTKKPAVGDNEQLGGDDTDKIYHKIWEGPNSSSSDMNGTNKPTSSKSRQYPNSARKSDLQSQSMESYNVRTSIYLVPPSSNKQEYLKYLDDDMEEDLYGDDTIKSEQMKFSNITNGRSSITDSTKPGKKSARSVSENIDLKRRMGNEHVHVDRLSKQVDDLKMSRPLSRSRLETKKSNDHLGVKTEDRLKSGVSHGGLDSETSTTCSTHDPGFDDWISDYENRERTIKENATRDWSHYRNFNSAATDYLGHKGFSERTDPLRNQPKGDYNVESSVVSDPTVKMNAPRDLSQYNDLNSAGENRLDHKAINEIMSAKSDQYGRDDVQESFVISRPPPTLPPLNDDDDNDINSSRSLTSQKDTELSRSSEPPLSNSLRIDSNISSKTTKSPVVNNFLNKHSNSDGTATSTKGAERQSRNSFPSTFDGTKKKPSNATSTLNGANFTKPEYAAILKDSFNISRPSYRNKTSNDHSAVKGRSSTSFSTKDGRTPLDSMTNNANVNYQTVGEGADRYWYCSECKTKNFMESLNCTYCHRSKIEDWKCTHCTFINVASTSSFCEVCKNIRDYHSGTGQLCSQCKFINNPESRKCKICDGALSVYSVNM